MKKVTLILAIQLCFILIGYGQPKQEEKPKFVRMPIETGAAFATFQSKCPLKFADFELFVTEDGDIPKLRYIVKNTSSKAIRFFSVKFYKKFTVSQWGRYGISKGLEVGREDGSGSKLLLPNETFENISTNEFDVIPMNNKVEALLKSKKGDYEMKIMWVALVTKIVFEDGTIYEDKALSNNLFDSFFNHTFSKVE